MQIGRFDRNVIKVDFGAERDRPLRSKLADSERPLADVIHIDGSIRGMTGEAWDDDPTDRQLEIFERVLEVFNGLPSSMVKEDIALIGQMLVAMSDREITRDIWHGDTL